MMRTSYQHWLSGYAYAPAIPDEQMRVVLRGVRQGDPEAISEMIEGHLRLANGMVARYLSAASKIEPDELVSVAFFAVVHAVNRIAAGHMDHDNVGGYISRFLHQYLHKALKDRSVINCPRGCEGVTCCQLEGTDIPVQPDTSMDVEEAVESLVNDEVDAKIVRMLRLGYAPADIARDLDMHKGNVSRRIHRIRETYMELINE